jgi:membrane-associated phospholipid phosphatase
MRRSLDRLARTAAVVAVMPVALAAQTPMRGDSIHAGQTLFTWRDAALAGGFVAATIAMFPLDRATALRLQNSNTQANRSLENAAINVRKVADPGSIVIGVSMYAVGRVGRWRELADLGLHGTEAVAISGAATALIKDLAGRARPYVSRDTNAHDFAFGRGIGHGGGYQSFPSGHASAAFAAASVVTSESQRWWPRGTRIVAPLMYGGATLVALSRMYNNAHWASDVMFGAALGTFSGIKVVRYSHGHSNNFIDRTLLGLTMLPTPSGGAAIGVSVTQ